MFCSVSNLSESKKIFFVPQAIIIDISVLGTACTVQKQMGHTPCHSHIYYYQVLMLINFEYISNISKNKGIAII